MKVGIMQPYFFPYIGYYSLIKYTDKWIVFDTVQFIRHGWIERNRILKPGEGWQYIAVPLQKHKQIVSIKDSIIRNTEDWKGKMFRQLDHYKKAPFYNQTISMMKEALAIETDSIVALNTHVLKVSCDYLSIPFDVSIFSEMDMKIDPVNHPGEWALNISKAMGATEYINPPGGLEIFDQEQFDNANIKLSFLKNKLVPYSQRRKEFENGLSIIDVLMYNDIPKVMEMIDSVEYFTKAENPATINTGI